MRLQRLHYFYPTCVYITEFDPFLIILNGFYSNLYVFIQIFAELFKELCTMYVCMDVQGVPKNAPFRILNSKT